MKNWSNIAINKLKNKLFHKGNIKNMEYIDELVVTKMSKYEEKEKIQQTWEEQLENMIECINSKGYIILHKKDVQTKVEQLSLFNDSLKIYMPEDFEEMSLENKKQKYTDKERPDLIYQNNGDTINIAFSLIEIDEKKEELLNLRDGMKKGFISANSSSKILDTGDFSIGENKIAYYTLSSSSIGGRIFNVIFITFIGEKVLVCNMNCLANSMVKLKPLFYGIMKTIEIKKPIETPIKHSSEEIELEKETKIKPIPTAKQLGNRLFFKKEQLMALPVALELKREVHDGYQEVKTPSGTIRDDPKYKEVKIVICKNENGETPLNNLYALDQYNQLLWIVQSEEADFEKNNDSPFITVTHDYSFVITATDKDRFSYGIRIENGRIVKKEIGGKK